MPQYSALLCLFQEQGNNPYSLHLPPGKLQNPTVLPAIYIPQKKKQSNLLKCKLYRIIPPIWFPTKIGMIQNPGHVI